jgi:hypothetical protein
MTKLLERKSRLHLVTSARYQRRPLVIEVTPRFLGIRERYRHFGFRVAWETIYLRAAEAQQASSKIAAERPRHRTLAFAEVECPANATATGF